MVMASFGEKLRHEREMRGISLREIAEATKIGTRFLAALEEDRLSVLPGGLFPRAFIKQYAEYLGLDTEDVLAKWRAAHGEPSAERQPPPAPAPARTPLVTPARAILAGLGLIVVALSLRGPTTEDVARGRIETAPTSLATEPVVRAVAPVYSEAVPSEVAMPTNALVLTMMAQQDCWVEVRTDGATVINRVLAEGESQTLEARGEIVLSVGNAGGLEILLNDHPARPLGRSGEVRKNIVITRQNLPSLVDETRPSGDGQSG